MKKIGIIGCGWLGSRLAERLSSRYQIFATTTTISKLNNLQLKGYIPYLVNFRDQLDNEIKPWYAVQHLEAIVICVPFSGINDEEKIMAEKRDKLLHFLGDYNGQVFLMSSTSVYPQDEKDFVEDNLPAKNVESENFILNKFPQTNILRLAGLMGDNRQLKNYNIKNTEQMVNHIHYADVCSAIEKMLICKTESEVYNIVAPNHPSKQEVICAQNGWLYDGEITTIGRTISPKKLINKLDFNFSYLDPRYFHE